MSLHPRNFELQDVVELKYDGRKEYGVIVEMLAPGKRPTEKSGFTAIPGVRLSEASAVVRIDLKLGGTSWDWRKLSELTHVYCEHAKPVC